ncbi:MAG: methylated-DNA--[protein]-cysteine S-methyltransferase [Myxococcales bacterium FL481]|nr:MAG: methylated-DNA--[protein]-cysteine S-methyltransferase [Myxococcales bacterium FL481]
MPADAAGPPAPSEAPTAASHYRVVADCIEYLLDRDGKRPTLSQLARRVGLSPSHLQRVFVEWAGVSPKEFTQNLDVARARRLLDEGRSLMSTAFELGLSSSSRLHDLFVRVESMTPAEYRARAAGLRIAWATFPTPYGPALFASTERGICQLSFVADDAQGLEELTREWPQAELEHQPPRLAEVASEVATRMAGGAPKRRLGLLLRGSPLRLQVWRALLHVDPGCCTSYGDLAAAVGRPGAAQAVGQAVGANRLAYLVPCHRVIRASGEISDYRWSRARKLAMLGREWATPHAAQP